MRGRRRITTLVGMRVLLMAVLICIGSGAVAQVHDIGVLLIIEPPDTVLLDSTYAPMVNVGNFGDTAETFDIYCTIDGYVDTQTVLDLQPFNQTAVTFDDWSVPPADSALYAMRVHVAVPLDTSAVNDTLTKQIYARDGAGPVPDSAVASDGTNELPGIDDDDYVVLYFDETTNKPAIDALNIDAVLSLSGTHTWLDGFGAIEGTVWNPEGSRLKIDLSTDVGPPTVESGDTISPDGVTITDEWGNACDRPVIVTGYFGPFHNVAVISIESPPDTVFTDSVYSPQASIVNFGNKAESLAVACSLDGYIDTVIVDGFLAGDTAQVVFSDWTVQSADTATYLMVVDVILLQDSVSSDDTLTKTIHILDGSGPAADSAIASDGVLPDPNIDEDDYVTMYFNEETNKPAIDSSNIDSVLRLSSGHSWQDGLGTVVWSEWDLQGKQLTIHISPFLGWPPSVWVGDTIYPDGVTILDVWGNASSKWVLLGGSFGPTGVDGSAYGGRIPRVTRLRSCSPNPFSSWAAIDLDVSVATRVDLSISDVAGRMVERLHSGTFSPGSHRVIWKPGTSVPAGVYFAMLRTEGYRSCQKLVLLN